MTERIVTKRLGIQDEIGNRLLEIRTQRDAHLSTSTINLQVNADGIERARRASAQARAESAGVIRDLGEAISSRAVKPLADYQGFLGAAMQATRTLGSGAANSPEGGVDRIPAPEEISVILGFIRLSRPGCCRAQVVSGQLPFQFPFRRDGFCDGPQKGLNWPKSCARTVLSEESIRQTFGCRGAFKLWRKTNYWDSFAPTSLRHHSAALSPNQSPSAPPS